MTSDRQSYLNKEIPNQQERHNERTNQNNYIPTKRKNDRNNERTKYFKEQHIYT